MTNLGRVYVEWTGWQGAPGTNVLHFSGGETAPGVDAEVADLIIDQLGTLYTAIAPSLTNTVTVRVPDLVEIIDSDSGQLVDAITTDHAAVSVTGSSTEGMLPPMVMALAQFNGDGFINGRRVKGRAYLGPLSRTLCTTAGEVSAQHRGNIATAFAPIITGTGPRLCIYHRPAPGQTTGGSWTDVASVVIPPKFAVLSSRRD